MVDTGHRAAEDLAKTTGWSEGSLRYAREHDQRKLILMLEAVKVEVELEGALLALPLGELAGPERDNARSEATPQENEEAADTADDALAREQAERNRARERRARENQAREDAAWELFMREELREVELRKNGQLARLLGESLPGEPAAALRRLASEDQRQAEEGLVALMSKGKVIYKHVAALCPEDRPARLAANRARMTWLKERRDGWLV